MNKSYSELLTFPTFKGRFEYLKLSGSVGLETFGSSRWLNQDFYHTREWRNIRNHIIMRDNGCDLADPDREIMGRIYIHHINPITEGELYHSSSSLLDPENLICVSFDTHNAIHYGDYNLIAKDYIPRQPGDTKLW